MGTSLPPLPASSVAAYHLGHLTGAVGAEGQPILNAIRVLAPEYRVAVAALGEHLIQAVALADDYDAVDDGRLGTFGSPSNDGGYSAD